MRHEAPGQKVDLALACLQIEAHHGRKLRRRDAPIRLKVRRLTEHRQQRCCREVGRQG